VPEPGRPGASEGYHGHPAAQQGHSFSARDVLLAKQSLPRKLLKNSLACRVVESPSSIEIG